MYSRTAFLTFVLMCCMLFLGLAWSQKAAENVSQSQKTTDWSLQFQIEDNINLKSFNDAFFAAKKQISANGAIRFGFDIRYSDANDSKEGKDWEDYKEENEYTDFSLNLNCLYLCYPGNGRTVKYFIGAGPAFGYQKFNKELNRNSISPDSLTSSKTITDKRDGYNWGVQLATGVEWSVKSNISIHAEYFARAAFTKGSTTVETDYNSSNPSNRSLNITIFGLKKAVCGLGYLCIFREVDGHTALAENEASVVSGGLKPAG